VLVVAKATVAGRVKTRLCPPCSEEEAAAVAEAALADTLEAVAACAASRRIVALDGDPGHWLPAGFEIIPPPWRRLAQQLAQRVGRRRRSRRAAWIRRR
jgi:2-phospho-L-lactate guanylyltransferase (CobY/MobA/RfbA family)